jgi:large subunit ribosomal protein L22
MTERVIGNDNQVRVGQAEARRVLARVQGMTATRALHALRFSAGTACVPVARVVTQAMAEAQRTLGLGGEALVVVSSEVGEGESLVRMRRLAHGMADWITTETADIRVELAVATTSRETSE